MRQTSGQVHFRKNFYTNNLHGFFHNYIGDWIPQKNIIFLSSQLQVGNHPDIVRIIDHLPYTSCDCSTSLQHWLALRSWSLTKKDRLIMKSCMCEFWKFEHFKLLRSSWNRLCQDVAKPCFTFCFPKISTFVVRVSCALYLFSTCLVQGNAILFIDGCHH